MEKGKIITKTIAVADVVNSNSRVYSIELIEDIIEQFKIRQGSILGELQKDVSEVVSLNNATHVVDDLRIIENHGYKLLQADIFLLKKGIEIFESVGNNNIALSLRGTGNLARPICYCDNKTGFLEGEHHGCFVENYNFITVDLINKQDSAYAKFID